MKKITALTAGVSSLLIMNCLQAATVNREAFLNQSHTDKASLKVQFSGGCKGSNTITSGIGVRFKQTFSTDANNHVIGDSLAQEFTVTNTNHTPSSANEDRVFLTTGHMQATGYPSPAVLVDSTEKLTETLKKDVATVTYVNKSPNILIRQFNYQLDNLSSGGMVKELGKLSGCLADYNSRGVDTAHETTYAMSPFSYGWPLLDKYVVDSSKKTNINAKLLFTKNSNTGLYTNAKSLNVKVTMSGVLQPRTAKCSGNFNKYPLKSSCKTLPPVKYKVSFLISGDIAT